MGTDLIIRLTNGVAIKRSSVPVPAPSGATGGNQTSPNRSLALHLESPAGHDREGHLARDILRNVQERSTAIDVAHEPTTWKTRMGEVT